MPSYPDERAKRLRNAIDLSGMKVRRLANVVNPLDGENERRRLYRVLSGQQELTDELAARYAGPLGIDVGVLTKEDSGE
jgi:hypothetical protein